MYYLFPLICICQKIHTPHNNFDSQPYTLNCIVPDSAALQTIIMYTTAWNDETAYMCFVYLLIIHTCLHCSEMVVYLLKVSFNMHICENGSSLKVLCIIRHI